MLLRNTTLFIFCFLFSTISSWSQSKLIDRVVAKVGSEFILLSDVEDQFNYLRQQDPSIGEEGKCLVLENLIGQKLIIYQAILDSVQVSDEEVETQLDLRFEHTLRQMNGDEQFFQQYYGATVEEMKDRYREDQKQQILAERMQQQLVNSVSITPKEVKDFFAKIPVDSIPFLPSEVELGEIVMNPIILDSEKAEARKELEDIVEKIESGEATFEEMAVKHSDDKGSGSRGGDLGFAKRGTYVPEFEATVYNLREGETSGIIETEFGYHIIKLLERRGNTVRAKHILIKPEITDISIERAVNKLDSVKNLIELDSMTFEQAVKQYSLESASSYSNNGKMKNPQTGNNFFETDDLDPDIYFEIIEIEPGEITEPMVYTSRRGDQQIRIIQLQSMTKPHKANLEQDYDKIAGYAKESKKAEYFNTWLEEKLEESYIKVDPLFQDCENINRLLQQ